MNEYKQSFSGTWRVIGVITLTLGILTWASTTSRMFSGGPESVMKLLELLVSNIWLVATMVTSIAFISGYKAKWLGQMDIFLTITMWVVVTLTPGGPSDPNYVHSYAFVFTGLFVIAGMVTDVKYYKSIIQ